MPFVLLPAIAVIMGILSIPIFGEGKRLLGTVFLITAIGCAGWLIASAIMPLKLIDVKTYTIETITYSDGSTEQLALVHDNQKLNITRMFGKSVPNGTKLEVTRYNKYSLGVDYIDARKNTKYNLIYPGFHGTFQSLQ